MFLDVQRKVIKSCCWLIMHVSTWLLIWLSTVGGCVVAVLSSEQWYKFLLHSKFGVFTLPRKECVENLIEGFFRFHSHLCFSCSDAWWKFGLWQQLPVEVSVAHGVCVIYVYKCVYMFCSKLLTNLLIVVIQLANIVVLRKMAKIW